MSAKHTPGPWLEVDPGHIYDQSLKLVAVVQHGTSAKANARLIAAAPDMHAELIAKDAAIAELVHTLMLAAEGLEAARYSEQQLAKTCKAVIAKHGAAS